MTLLAKFWLWLISIGLSIVIWLSVQVIQEQGDRYFDVPLKLINMPTRGLVVTGISDLPVSDADHLHVTLHATGPQNMLEELSKEKLEAEADCRNLAPGRPKLKVILPAIPNRFGGVKFDSASVTLHIEEEVVATKEVEVEPIGDFNLRNYIYDSATVEPDTIDIRGPKSQVASVKRARVVLNLSDVVKNQMLRLKVELLNKDGVSVEGVTPLTTSVDVRPSVVPAPQNKMLLVQPILSGDLPAPGYEAWGMHVSPSQVSVVGDSEELARTTTIDTMPISLNGLTSTSSIRVRLKVPGALKIQGSDSVTVRVNIRQSTAVLPAQKPTPKKTDGTDAQIPLP